jgi:hypothetical protein
MLAHILNKLVPALAKLEEFGWLIFLSDLLENKELKRLLDYSTIQILEKD